MAMRRLIIAGSGGPMARRISDAMDGDFDVVALTRSVDGSEPDGARPAPWNPRAVRDHDEPALDDLAQLVDGAHAIVNLAGAPIDRGRFGRAHRRRLIESRVDATTTLVAAVRRAGTKPSLWVQGSASGHYGDRGDEILTESASPGRDFFLSDVTRAWEHAAEPVAAHCRYLVIRCGVVLSPDAPAWNKMLLPIRLFVGGPLGPGDQWFPWIEGHDLGRAVRFLIDTPGAAGTFNVAAPHPVRQKDLARAAASRLGRPASFPAPAPLLRVVLGGLADQLLLPSQRVVPERLTALGFHFVYPTIDAALDELLGSS